MDPKITVKKTKNPPKKLSTLSKIYFLIRRRVLSNFQNRSFYILQFIIPAIITLISCLISIFLTKGYTNFIYHNLEQFSRTTPFTIPVTHNVIKQKSKINNILKYMLKNFHGLKGLDFLDYYSENPEYEICKPQSNDTCKLNEIPFSEIKNFDSKFKTLIHRNESYSLQLINKCDLINYILRTKSLYAYKR